MHKENVSESFTSIPQISKLYLVPPVLLFLAKSPLVEKYDLSSVTEVMCGAAPLTADLEKEFLTRFGIDFVCQGRN